MHLAVAEESASSPAAEGLDLVVLPTPPTTHTVFVNVARARARVSASSPARRLADTRTRTHKQTRTHNILTNNVCVWWGVATLHETQTTHEGARRIVQLSRGRGGRGSRRNVQERTR